MGADRPPVGTAPAATTPWPPSSAPTSSRLSVDLERRGPGLGRPAPRCAPSQPAAALRAIEQDESPPSSATRPGPIGRPAPRACRATPMRPRVPSSTTLASTPLNYFGRLAAEDLGPADAAATRARAADGRGTPRGAQPRGPGARAAASSTLGLRSEGVREWNFSLRGMGDRALLAAAQEACDREVWDRCINTSERTRAEIDIAQRYPLPFRDRTHARGADAAGLDAGLCLRAHPPGVALRAGCALPCRRVRADAGHARHGQVDGQEGRPGLQRRPASTTATSTCASAPTT